MIKPRLVRQASAKRPLREAGGRFMAILWPQASSSKVDHQQALRLPWCRITIGWGDARLGAPEM